MYLPFANPLSAIGIGVDSSLKSCINEEIVCGEYVNIRRETEIVRRNLARDDMIAFTLFQTQTHTHMSPFISPRSSVQIVSASVPGTRSWSAVLSCPVVLCIYSSTRPLVKMAFRP